MCNHEKGSLPYRCYKPGLAITKCQEECDKFSSCVGYSTSTDCNLFPASVGCPTGWNFDTGLYAKTPLQLVASERNGSNCFVKQGVISRRDKCD